MRRLCIDAHETAHVCSFAHDWCTDSAKLHTCAISRVIGVQRPRNRTHVLFRWYLKGRGLPKQHPSAVSEASRGRLGVKQDISSAFTLPRCSRNVVWTLFRTEY